MHMESYAILNNLQTNRAWVCLKTEDVAPEKPREYPVVISALVAHSVDAKPIPANIAIPIPPMFQPAETPALTNGSEIQTGCLWCLFPTTSDSFTTQSSGI